MRYLTMVFCVTLLSSPATLVGQQVDRTAKRAADCAHAAQVIQAATQGSERAVALDRLAACGVEGGQLLARELRQLRTEADTTPLLRDYYKVVRIRDASVLDTALDLMADRGATAEARIVAMKIIVAYSQPTRVSLPFANFVPGGGHTLASQDHFGQHEGAVLPAGWTGDAMERLGELAADPSESTTIRYAASVALRHIQ